MSKTDTPQDQKTAQNGKAAPPKGAASKPDAPYKFDDWAAI